MNTPAPVARLLALGKEAPWWTYSCYPKDWPNYPEVLGLGPQDAPALINLLVDPAIRAAEAEDPACTAAIHAWRALGQLGAIEAIPPLLALLGDAQGDDYILEGIPEVLGLLGAAAIAPTQAFLIDDSQDRWARIAITRAFVAIAQRHPEATPDCVTALATVLKRFQDQDQDLNGFLVGALVKLQARETLPLIQAAFAARRVVLTVAGDLEDVEIALGVRERRITPKPDYLRAWANQKLRPAGAPTLTPVRRPDKVGRNAPCPCGSGKKYKKCCIAP
jgi:hypothetical protein